MFSSSTTIADRVLVLHEFIAINRDQIICRCRAKVSGRSTPPPTEAEIDHGVPVLLDQLRDGSALMHSVGIATGHDAGALPTTADEDVAGGCAARLHISASTERGAEALAREIHGVEPLRLP